MPLREDPGDNEPGGDAGATARPQRGPRGRAFRVTEHDDRGKPGPSTRRPARVNPSEFAEGHRWGRGL